MKARRVIIRKCEEYDPAAIEGIVRESMQDLAEKPSGRILIKPNVVVANTGYIHHAHTEPRMVEAMVNVLRGREADPAVTIGESGGIGMPTRLMFSESGYLQMARRLNVPLSNFNTERTEQVGLSKAKWHKTMLVAKSLYEADYKIWMPKLKYHIVCQITNALKLNIGILTHKERFLYHDHRLNEKIVDMLQIGYPNLIVTDAITIGHGFESSPYPFRLGAIIISNDPLAVDMVAARILNYEPEEVLHLVEASERGYGSLDFDEIEITGDVDVEELSAKTRSIECPYPAHFGLDKVKTPIKFYEGINRDTGTDCCGGCVCSIKGVLGTAEKRYPGTLANARKGAIVMGYYKGDVVHPGEPVALIGTCSGVEGRLEAGKIIRVKGCPPKVASLAIKFLYKFKIRSPAFEPVTIAKLVYHSVIEQFTKVLLPFSKKIDFRENVMAETGPDTVASRGPEHGRHKKTA
ncbi:MAG: DUF362 domain-containing protein [Candidatus Abyssubacteria bacterium]|nr:DUF362 domain-containing protein [Candidatus Abyssubacteria bacterium]